MKANIDHAIDHARNEVIKCLAGKSIFEMTVWTRDHAQYLEWFCNYDENKIDALMRPYMSLAQYLSDNVGDDPDATEQFKAICADLVIKLEISCR